MHELKLFNGQQSRLLNRIGFLSVRYKISNFVRLGDLFRQNSLEINFLFCSELNLEHSTRVFLGPDAEVNATVLELLGPTNVEPLELKHGRLFLLDVTTFDF